MARFESNLTKRGVALTAALTLSASAIAGCTESKKPKASEKPSATSTTVAPTTTTLAPEVKLSAGSVASGHMGALKDLGMQATSNVDDVYSYGNENTVATDVAKARRQVSAIASALIQQRADRYLDLELAKQTTFPQFISFKGADMSENAKIASDLNTVVGLILDPTIKQEAASELAYQEGAAALIASSESLPTQAQFLISLIKDPTIALKTQSEISSTDTNTATDQPSLAQQAQTLSGEFNTQESSAWASLYDGSNSQAISINKDINQYNAAVQRDGQ